MNMHPYVPIFYERKMRDYAHLLDIGPMEKILEALENFFYGIIQCI